MNMEPLGAAPSKSIWGIIGDVFFSPAEAFAAFKQKPTIWVPLILTIVMASTAGYFTAEEAAMDQYNMMKTSTIIPPQALEEMRQDAQNPGKLGATLGAAITVPLITMVSALLAWFFGGFLFGGKAKFMEIWGAGLLAGLIPMLGGLVRIPMVIAKGTAQVSVGPAALLAKTDYVSVLQFFFMFSDVFAIWSLVVISYGYSAIFGISVGKGVATALITWSVMVVLALGMIIGGVAMAGVDIRFM